MTFNEISIAVLAFLGALLCLIAGIGMIRMPDLYLRMSVTTKAATLGVGFMMFSAALYFQDTSVSTKVGAVILFTFLTAPIAAHLLGRAAYILGVPMWKKSVMDELKGQYQGHTQILASDDPNKHSDTEKQVDDSEDAAT